jgi:cytochrome P450
MGLFWLVLSSAALGLALHLAFSIATFLLATRRPPNYPPGPPPVLGLGNLHQMPADRPFLQFHKWFREHGDIVGLKVGPKNIVVLSNPVHVRELFGRRGGGGAPSYADRPRSAVLDDYIAKDGDATWITLGDGATLRRWRAATRHAMGPEGIARVAPVQSAMGNRMLHDLLREPESWPQSLRRWALASPLFASRLHFHTMPCLSSLIEPVPS